MADGIVKDVKKGVDYFVDLLKGKKPQMEKMERAIEPSQKPPAEQELIRRSTGGSPPFTGAELKRGYRKV